MNLFDDILNTKQKLIDMFWIKEYRGFRFDIIIGMSIGFVVLFSLTFPMRWTITILAGLVCCLVGILYAKHFEKICYACFIIFLPIQLGKSFFYVPYAGGGHEIRINLPEIFFVILLILWLKDFLTNNRSRNIIDNRLLISGGLFLLISLLSLLRATNVMLGNFELIRAAIAFLIFIYIAYHVDTEKKLNITIALLLFGALFQIGIGLHQWIFEKDLGLYLFGEMSLGNELWSKESIARVGGLLGHPNAFATYLVMTLPFCLFFFTRDNKTIIKAASFTLFILGFFVLLATQSRGAWLGFVIALTGAFIWFIIYAKRFRIRRLGISIALVLALLVVSFVSYGFVAKRLFSDDKGSAASRIPMMSDALNIIMDNPILGIGINNYALSVHKYDTTGIHSEWQATTVHNLFLLVAAESGVFALAAFAIFWFFIFLKSLSLVKVYDPKYFILALALSMSLVGFFIILQVDPNYRFYPAIQREIWMISGLVSAATGISKRSIN